MAGSAAEELGMMPAELFAMELNSSAAAMTTMATAGNQWRARRLWVGYHDGTSPMKRLLSEWEKGGDMESNRLWIPEGTCRRSMWQSWHGIYPSLEGGTVGPRLVGNSCGRQDARTISDLEQLCPHPPSFGFTCPKHSVLQH